MSSTDSNSALDELRTRLRSDGGTAQPAAPRRLPSTGGTRRYAIPALVMCILGVVVFFGLRMWPAAGEAARTLRARVASTLPMLRDAIAQEPAAAEGSLREPSARPGSRRSPRSARRPPPLVSTEAVAPALEAPDVLVEHAPVPPAVAIEEPSDPIVYSSADGDVAPPKARLVDVPGTALGGRRPASDILELLVNDSGVVERARLHTREPQMLDSMLLSRVKTWRFNPARRNGHAVAYRLLLVWDGSQFRPAPDPASNLPVSVPTVGSISR